MSRPSGSRVAGRPAAASSERLKRLLALVPYVVSRKVVGLAETAAAFGVSESELVEDLNMLWCVELLDPHPYCPIDLSYEGGEIVVSQAESMDRPLRLGVDEASALLVALRMLADMDGFVAAAGGEAGGAGGAGGEAGGEAVRGEPAAGGSALSRTIAKLEAAAGEAAAVSAQVAVQLDEGAERGLLMALREAMGAGRRVHLSYYVPGRDEATERDVDPMRLLAVEGRTYLEGWCRRAEAVRLFRLDRMLRLEVLQAAAEVPLGAEPVDVDKGLYQPSPTDVRVVIELTPGGRWVAEYYPCESVTELGEGRLRVVLRTPDTAWVIRLALRLGEHGRIVEPARLAGEVHERAAAALALYAPGAHTPGVALR